MRIRIPIINKKWDEWDIALFCYPICIFAVSIERYINYTLLITIIFLILSMLRRKKVYMNMLCMLWIVYLFLYPFGDYILRCQSGVENYILLGYILPLVFLIIQEIDLKRYKAIEYYMLLLAVFEAGGYILSKVVHGIYAKVAYRLVSRYSELGSFTVNNTVAAFIIAIGVAIVLSWILECNAKETIKRRKLYFLMLVLIVGLIYSGKRTIFVTTLVCSGFIYMINQVRNFNDIVKYILIGVVAALVLVGISILVYYLYGSTNAIGRLGATFIGISNKEDVSNYRSILASYMIQWWKESEETIIYGIGWGNFHNRIIQYVNVPNGHCVYLQLLCEEGMIGLLFFVVISIITVAISFQNVFCRKYRKIEKRMANIALFGQILFLVYCYTGNAIYDMYCYLYFFLFVGWTVLLSKKRRNTIGRVIQF